jgi:hypothetical protein
VPFQKKEIIFAQGDACDAVFYIQKGKVRLPRIRGSEDQSRDAGRDGGHHSVAGELFHEPVQEIRIY